MNEELEAIEFSKLMIEEQVNKGKVFVSGKPFMKYQKVYFSTNENIKDYTKLVDLKGNALTVMASGDHALNLINIGVKNIDTFDTNYLTQYLCLGLKFAMINKYSYCEYIETFKKLVNINTSLEEVTSILENLLVYMDTKYRIYWKKIIDFNYRIQNKKSNINLIYMLFININNIEFAKFYNNYLENEEEYNKLKSRLNKANITFNNINAINIADYFNKEYDSILLSNILDYFNTVYEKVNKKFDKDELNDYILKLKSLINENGTIFLKYIFRYASDNYRIHNIFMNSNIKDTDLTRERIQLVKSIESNCYDGIVLSKKY